MTHKHITILFFAMVATGSLNQTAIAEQHANEALQHATEAAKSVGDSQAVGEHASEALKHIEAAKEGNPPMANKLEKSETDLNSAVEHAKHYNSDSARKDAEDAKKHLEDVH